MARVGALRIFGLCPIVEALLVASPTRAAPADDSKTCAEASGDVAIAACTRAIKSGRFKGHDLASQYVNRGVEYNSASELDRAIADFSEAIRLNPKFAMAFYNRGIAYRSKNDPDRAIADYNEAIRLNPKYGSAFNNRGLVFYSPKKNYDRAIADYNEAIRLDPKNARAFNNRGNAYDDKNDHDRAIADYNEAIRLDPEYAIAFNNRGDIHEVGVHLIALLLVHVCVRPRSSPAIQPVLIVVDSNGRGCFDS